MAYKQIRKQKSSAIKPIAFGVGGGLLFQLVLALIVSFLTARGSVQETMLGSAAVAVRTVGLFVTMIITWLLSFEKKVNNASVSAGIVVVLPIVLSLLFWGVELSSFLVGACIQLVVYALCIWVLVAAEKGKAQRFTKHRYR